MQETGRELLFAALPRSPLAAAIGVTQWDLTAVLAYSSVSQMGLAAVVLGVVLALPRAWLALRPELLLFSAHHALAKGALLLGVGDPALRNWTGSGRHALHVGR